MLVMVTEMTAQIMICMTPPKRPSPQVYSTTGNIYKHGKRFLIVKYQCFQILSTSIYLPRLQDEILQSWLNDYKATKEIVVQFMMRA
jgi:hypothetical protein